MNKRYRLNLINTIVCLVILTLWQMPLAMASSYQSHQSIYHVAKTYVATQVISSEKTNSEITIGKLDSRLKLKKCNKSLHAFMPKGSRSIGKTTVGVKCDGVTPWSLHVSVTISRYENVLVAAHQLQKGSVLRKVDIRLKSIDIATLPYGYIEDIKSGEGMKLKRRVLTGAVLTPSMLKKPQIISRGQQVTILAQSGSMSVRMNGKALANGAIGDRIKVINLKSRKKLEGIITMTGEVKVEI